MESRAKRRGHPIHQMVMVFMLSAPRAPEGVARALSFGGAALALFTGWLGGELVDRLSVGVDEGAHLDAPSSLRTRRVRA